jgi:diguanylate cyclase (GGDEF)-like protein/PAS domain S-box-containing protein
LRIVALTVDPRPHDRPGDGGQEHEPLPRAARFRRRLHADGRIGYERKGLGGGRAAAGDGTDDLAARLHPDDRERWREAFEQSAAARDSLEIDVRAPDRNGGVRWLRAIAQPARSADGGTVWEGFLFDVTRDRRRVQELESSERRLRESEQRLRDLAESASDWFWETDAELRFVRFSQQYYRSVGDLARLRLGARRSDARIDDPADGDWEAHLADLEARRPFRDFVYAMRDLEGRRRIFTTSGRPVFGAGGHFRGYRGTAREITAEVVAKEQLEHERHLLATAIEALDEGFSLFDENDRFVLCNSRYREIYQGVADLYVPGTAFRDIVRTAIARGMFPEASGREEAWLKERLLRRAQPHDVQEHRLADGRWLMLSDHKLPNGWTVGIRVDVTEPRRREEALAHAHSLLNRLVDNTPLAVIERDRRLRVRRWAGQAETIFGWSAGEAIGRTLGELGLSALGETTELDPAAQGLPESDRRHDVLLARNHTRGGELRHCRWYNSIVRPGDDDFTVLSLVEDVTERIEAESHIRHLAQHDPLTDLPNRMLFNDRLGQALALAARAGSKVALVLIDLDGFKEVNDTLGHPAGDQLLRVVAERLRACVRTSDTVARLGGDEFGLILTGLHRPADATVVADKIQAALQEPVPLPPDEMRIGLCMGITMYPDDDGSAAALLRNADLALYRAKGAGEGAYRFFGAEMRKAVERRRGIESDLRRAIGTDAFELHYQPQMRLADSRPGSVEALLRWRHPDRGLLAPAEFLEVAESSGLVVAIGEIVLRRACAQLSAWRRAGIALDLVAVHPATAQCRSGDLVDLVRQVLAEHDLRPADLELEITEQVIAGRDREAVVELLAELHGLGVSLSLDDFGTGYASLTHLKALPVDRLKIDRGFVAGIGRDPESSAIVQGVARLARGLGLEVIAEGVETEEQLAFLRRCGCDVAQGYLIAPPMPPEALEPRLAACLGRRAAPTTT